VYTDARFREEYGIEPLQFTDVKAFMGDASDGYPGVKGIGPKTALQLIQTHGSIDGVLSAIDSLKPAQRKKIEENLEMLKLSRQLAAIDMAQPIEVDLDALLLKPYEAVTFAQVEEVGYRLIGKHARSLGVFA